MRCLSVLALVLCAASAFAQETTPDPTPPHRYFPLSVGDEWQYINLGLNVDFSVGEYTRRQIVQDSVVGAIRYLVETTTQYDRGQDDWDRARTRVLRYDTVSTRVFQLWNDGTEWPIDCRFGADFGEPVACGIGPSDEFGDDSVAVAGGLDAQIAFGEESQGSGPSDTGGSAGDLSVDAVKTFSYIRSAADLTTYTVYAAPIGYVGEDRGYCNFCTRTLTYARVRQDDGSVYEVGRQYAVAAEGDAPAAPALALAVHPNPTAGPLAVVVDVPQPSAVAVEVFDALGRRVLHRDLALGAGRQRVEVDAGDWAPGLYVVRITVGETAAVARVVRR